MKKESVSFATLFLCVEACRELVDLLPETDLVIEIKNLICFQNKILCNKYDGLRCPKKQLELMIEYTKKIKEQTGRLKNAARKREK